MSDAASPAAPADAPGAAAPGPAPLTGVNLGITAFALAIGTFMQVLDTTIANVSIPTIAGDLGASVSQGAWVITAFAVANGVGVPLTGWLMQRFGVVRTFVVSVLLFTLMSFLCGIAWSLPSLVFFRILQGAVSGPLIPGSQALLMMIFGKERQATGLAIWSMTTLVAPICGPLLGGYISDNMHWSWIFLINVPIGLACAFLCWRGLSSRETPTRKLPVDTTGFALLVIWVGALQIMLDTGAEADWLSSPVIVAEMLIAVIGCAAWIIWELTAKHPIVNLSLFRNRNFMIGAILLSVFYAVFFGNAVLLPLWLQTQLGYIATWAGLVAAPSGLVAVLLTPLVARLLKTIGPRMIATISFVFLALSLFMRAGHPPDPSFSELVWPSLALGVAMSGFFISMLTISMSEIAPDKVPAASGLINFVRITVGSFAAALVTTMWDNAAALHQTRIAEETGAITDPRWAEAIRVLQEQGASLAQATGAMVQRAVEQALYIGALDLFSLSAWIVVVLLPIVWFARRVTPDPGAPPPAMD